MTPGMSYRMADIMVDAWPRLRHETLDRRIRARLDGATVVDTTRAVLVWEPGRISPSYAVPEGDVHADLIPAPSADAAPAGAVLHPGVPFGQHSTPGEPLSLDHGGRVHAGAAFRPADADLAGLVILDFGAFDAWLEEDDPLVAHARNPYHRVDVRPSRRDVRIEVDGRVLASTVRPTLVFETQLPSRFYVPRPDVVAEMVPSSRVSACAYKGVARYWTVGGVRDAAWSYERPVADASRLAGLIGFWNELVDIFVDGERRARPDTPIARLMADEFDLDVARGRDVA